MVAGFLLRFLEPGQPDGVADESIAPGSRAETVPPDEDPAPPLSGTRTLTEVKREQADPDPKSQSLAAIPR